MQRLVKILPKESLVPELGYLVFTENGLVAWNGLMGIRFVRERAGTRIMKLVDQYGPIVIQNGAKFLKVLSVLDSINSVSIDEAAHLIIKANKDSTEIKFAILVGDRIPKALPHLALNWNLEGGTKVPISGVWLDALDFLSNEGAILWGDVVGVYDTSTYTAAFDYGLLLYSPKTRRGFKGLSKNDEAAVAKETKYCPWSLLELGLATIKDAVFKEDALFLVGDELMYFTSLVSTASVLNQVLAMREEAGTGTKYTVSLDFSSNVWKRAKLFNKVVLTLTIKSGIITLSGGSWTEQIGRTDAPDEVFITRISLLQKWVTKCLGHQFAVSKTNSWMFLGTTRNEAEFYGLLTMVKPALADEDSKILSTVGGDGEENDGKADELVGLL
jgi:hypothetical protein